MFDGQAEHGLQQAAVVERQQHPVGEVALEVGAVQLLPRREIHHVGARAVQLDRTLAGLMTLRGAPRALMNLTRRVAEQSTAITVYVFPEGGVLEELVTADGYHHFSVPTRAALPERLARYIDQAQVAGSEDRVVFEGPTATLEAPGEAIAQQLADTRAMTVMTAAGAEGAGAQVSLMATSEAVLAMDTPEAMSESTEVREVSAEGLVALIAAAIPEVSGL